MAKPRKPGRKLRKASPRDKAPVGIAGEVAEGRIGRFDAHAWALVQEHKRRMPRFAAGSHDPGPAALKGLRKGAAGAFLPLRKGVRAELASGKNPAPRGSFGYAGIFVELKSRTAFTPGVLVLPLHAAKTGPAAPETLRLFRWHGGRGEFELLPESGVGKDHVWGLADRPGLYAAIGLPRDPAARATVRAFAAMEPYLRAADPGLRSNLQHRLCELVRCNPEWDRALQDGRLADALRGEGIDDGLPGGFTPGGRGCPDCRELVPPNGGLPETGLLPERCHCEEQPRWASMGPRNMSGCILQLAVDPGEPRRLYAAAADGGVWVLDDVDAFPQRRWRPLSDANPNLVAQAIAVAPSEPGTIYCADGATHVLRSTDRGQHWERPSSHWFNTVRRIAVDTQDEDVVYVAAANGLWRTTSAGYDTAASPGWLRVREGEYTDVVVDPSDARVIYAGRKLPDQPGDTHKMQLWRSPNRGIDWTMLFEQTVPRGAPSIMVRVALARSGDALHRTVGVKFGTGIWLNRQGPGSPRTILERQFVSMGNPGSERFDRNNGQGDWSHTFAIDPFDERVLLAGGQDYYRSTDGGATWSPVRSFHEDQQAIAFDPARRGRIFVAHDGGVAVADNNGADFNHETDATTRNLSPGLETMQFYKAGIAGRKAVANAYHWGTLATEDLESGAWTRIQGGGWEFADVYGDRHRPQFFYALGDELRRGRFPGIDGRSNFYPIAPHPTVAGGFDPNTLTVDPAPGSKRILAGARFTVSDTEKRVRILRTEDADFDGVLTAADGRGQLSPPMQWTVEAGLDLPDGDSVNSIVFAPGAGSVAYAGLESGKLFVCRDVPGRADWELAGTAPFGLHALAVHPADENRVYAVAAFHVLRSLDGGASWEEIAGTAPSTIAGAPFHSILMTRFDRLYVGAHGGVFMSPDEGEQWFPIDDPGLPNVPVNQLHHDGGWLYALTHGRGLWRIRAG